MKSHPSFLRSFLVYGTGNIVRRLGTVLLVPIYTRLLLPEDYGVLSLAEVFSRFLFNLLALGLPTSIFRFYQREETELGRRQVLGACLTMVALVAIPVALLMLAAPGIAAWLLDSRALASLLILGLITTYADIFSKIPYAPIRSENRAGLYVGLSGAQWLVTMALSIFLVVGLRRGPFGIMAAQAIAASAAAVALLVYLLRRGVARPRPGQIRTILAYGAPLIPAGMSQLLLVLADRYILKLYRPMSEVGLYSIGYRLGEGLVVATAAFTMTWTPFAFKEGHHEEGRKRMASIGSTWFGLIMLGAVGLALFAREILWILTPPRYHPAAQVVGPVVLGVALLAVLPIATTGLTLVDRTRYVAVLALLAAGLNIGLNFWWIPVHGIMGAAWATAVAYAFQLIAALALSQRFFPLRLPLWRWAAGGALSVACGALGLRAESLGLFPAVGLKAVALLAAFGGLTAVGLTRPGQIRGVFDAVRRSKRRS